MLQENVTPFLDDQNWLFFFVYIISKIILRTTASRVWKKVQQKIVYFQASQVKRTAQDAINEFIIPKLNPFATL